MSNTKVLVTGHRGRIGRELTRHLSEQGINYRGFDLVDGDDMLDLEALKTAVFGCTHIVHTACMIEVPETQETYRQNTALLESALAAAQHASVKRFVFLSSVNAMGIFRGESKPDYLPFDEEHPCRPETAYGKAKLDGEQRCGEFHVETGITTICIRPPIVWDDYQIAEELNKRARHWRGEWKPFWEYGAYIHIDDLCGALIASLNRPEEGHHIYLVTADDVCSETRARRSARWHAFFVPWYGSSEYRSNRFKALVQNTKAKRALRWQPNFSWKR